MKNNQTIGNKSHLITLPVAAAMNKLYREQKRNILNAGINPDVLPICETFTRDDIDSILAQPGCVALRIYFGMHDNMNISPVIVGVNDTGDDMVKEGTDNLIVDKGERCPMECPAPSPLNS